MATPTKKLNVEKHPLETLSSKELMLRFQDFMGTGKPTPAPETPNFWYAIVDRSPKVAPIVNEIERRSALHVGTLFAKLHLAWQLKKKIGWPTMEPWAEHLTHEAIKPLSRHAIRKLTKQRQEFDTVHEVENKKNIFQDTRVEMMSELFLLMEKKFGNRCPFEVYAEAMDGRWDGLHNIFLPQEMTREMIKEIKKRPIQCPVCRKFYTVLDQHFRDRKDSEHREWLKIHKRVPLPEAILSLDMEMENDEGEIVTLRDIL